MFLVNIRISSTGANESCVNLLLLDQDSEELTTFAGILQNLRF